MAYQYDENQGFRPEGAPPPRPPRKNDIEKNNNDLGSWIFIIVMLSIAWPVGLILLISKLSDSSGRKNRARRETARPSSAAQTAQPKVQQTMKQVTKTPEYTDKSAKTMKTIGAVLGILGCLALFSAVGENLSYAVQYSEWWYFLRQLFYPVGMLASGAALLLGSGGLKRRQRRYATYLRTAGQKPAVPLAHLARAADVSEKRLEKDLDAMLEKGLWGENAYIDKGSGMLFRSQEAASAYFAAANAAKQPQEAPAPAEGYDGVLRQIRDLNDRIADEALSAKIDRLEQVSGSIFKAIEDDEDKRAAAGKFLNYYLPTTLKLLENYAAFEEAGVSGENLSQAKAKIEKTMDSIVAGFEHQLDELYRSDAMDIDSDIRVMETMLRRDTASVADDFGLGGGTAVQQQRE
mgnify:FL=1